MILTLRNAPVFVSGATLLCDGFAQKLRWRLGKHGQTESSVDFRTMEVEQ